jgi:TetR/AcrR family transcriptional regulator, transcriptional repressor for nem operon
LKLFIDRYLSEEHRDHPEAGCVMSALANDVARRDRKVRAAFTETSMILLRRLAPFVRGTNERERIAFAGLLLSSMAGVLMVARVLADPASSRGLLEHARRFFRDSFAPE